MPLTVHQLRGLIAGVPRVPNFAFWHQMRFEAALEEAKVRLLATARCLGMSDEEALTLAEEYGLEGARMRLLGHDIDFGPIERRILQQLDTATHPPIPRIRRELGLKTRTGCLTLPH